MNVKEVLEFEVRNMPDSVAEDVLNFIVSYGRKTQDNGLTKVAQKYSEQAFNDIWDNEEDALYDKL